MVLEDIKRIKSGRRELRTFGLTIGIALAVFGGLFLWRGRGYYGILFAAAAAFLIVAFIVPVLLKPVQKAWMTLAIILGWVMTRVILCILFFAVVTPIGAFSRLFGKDFLSMKFDGGARSYWIRKEPVSREAADYERQF